MTAFQWFQVVMTGVSVLLIPFGVALWRKGRKSWERDRQLDEAIKQNDAGVTGLGQRLQREIKRVEALGDDKVDCKTYEGFQARVLMRLDYLEKRVDDTAAANTKRVDKESERLSHLTGKLTKWHEDCRDEFSEIRERLVRLEARPDKT